MRQCALKLEDKPLLASELSTGDLIAQGAKYHAQCLANLYNKARERKTAAESDTADATNHGIAFAELFSYIEDVRTGNLTVARVLKL